MILDARTCRQCGVVTLTNPSVPPSGAGGRGSVPRCGNCTTLFRPDDELRPVELRPPEGSEKG